MTYNDVVKAFIKGDQKAHSVQRTRRRMEEWLCYHSTLRDYHIYFATFTFKDVENRDMRKFTDYLRKTCNLRYVLCADYGKDYGRYHLHGFIATKEEVPKGSVFDRFGFTRFENANIYDMITYCVKYSVKLERIDKRDRLMLTRFPF